MATREELEADRNALRAARVSLLTGQAVKEFWRDGRRVVYQAMSATEIENAIAGIDAELADMAAAAGATRPRFHALRVRFSGR